MLLTSIGTPSALSYATAHILRRVGDVLFGGHVFASALPPPSSGDGGQGPSPTQPVVLFADLATETLSDTVAGRRLPFLLIVDDFVSVVADLMRARSMAYLPAVRFATQAFALLDMLPDNDVLRVTPADCQRPFRGFIDGMIRFYGLVCSEAQFDAIVASLIPGAGGDETLADYLRTFRQAAEVQSAVLTELQRGALDVLAASYDAMAAGRRPRSVTWPTSLAMRWGERPCALEGPIDLLGPARFIICGPYLHLPRGRWRMHVEIETRSCLSDNRIGADIFSETILAAATARLPSAGRYTFPLDFSIANPAAPLEIRIQVVTGCIEGSLELLGMDLEFLDGPLA